jgi:D-beta-D-heptose 7-phosphate kinase/D-beta-D-heptose 1-phosphate adenosyltransferase
MALIELLPRMRGKRVMVVGDITLDLYTMGQAVGISPEAPVPRVEVQSESHLLGGVANLLRNLQDLGGEGVPISVVGKDAEGERVLRELERMGAETSGILVEEGLSTPTVQRIMSPNGHQFLRLDRPRQRLNGEMVRRLVEEAEGRMGECGLVILADYGKGVMTPELAGEMASRARERGLKVVASPRAESFLFFRWADVLRTNRREASQVTGIPSQDEAATLIMGHKILSSVGCGAVFLTWVEGGSHLFEREGEVTFFPPLVRRPLDVTGVGDAMVGTLSLALAAGAGLREAAHLSHYAGAIVSCKRGLATASSRELGDSLREGEGFFRRLLGE